MEFKALKIKTAELLYLLWKHIYDKVFAIDLSCERPPNSINNKGNHRVFWNYSSRVLKSKLLSWMLAAHSKWCRARPPGVLRSCIVLWCAVVNRAFWNNFPACYISQVLGIPNNNMNWLGIWQQQQFKSWNYVDFLKHITFLALTLFIIL